MPRFEVIAEGVRFLSATRLRSKMPQRLPDGILLGFLIHAKGHLQAGAQIEDYLICEDLVFERLIVREKHGEIGPWG